MPNDPVKTARTVAEKFEGFFPAKSPGSDQIWAIIVTQHELSLPIRMKLEDGMIVHEGTQRSWAIRAPPYIGVLPGKRRERGRIYLCSTETATTVELPRGGNTLDYGDEGKYLVTPEYIHQATSTRAMRAIAGLASTNWIVVIGSMGAGAFITIIGLMMIAMFSGHPVTF